jgi:chorismate mutase
LRLAFLFSIRTRERRRENVWRDAVEREKGRTMMSIEDRRAEIDAIDAELLRLLNLRARLAVKVGESKRAAGLSVCDRARESEVIERACRANTGPLDESSVVTLFKCIIRASRTVEASAMAQSNAQQTKERA